MTKRTDKQQQIHLLLNVWKAFPTDAATTPFNACKEEAQIKGDMK
jgi:hypothetical protein